MTKCSDSGGILQMKNKRKKNWEKNKKPFKCLTKLLVLLPCKTLYVVCTILRCTTNFDLFLHNLYFCSTVFLTTRPAFGLQLIFCQRLQCKYWRVLIQSSLCSKLGSICAVIKGFLSKYPRKFSHL